MIMLVKTNEGYCLKTSDHGTEYVFAEGSVSGVELHEDYVSWVKNGVRVDLQFSVTGGAITYSNLRKSYSYHVDVGDRVEHCRQSGLTGVVTAVDRNLPDVTTCVVNWDDGQGLGVVWTNKIMPIGGKK